MWGESLLSGHIPWYGVKNNLLQRLYVRNLLHRPDEDTLKEVSKVLAAAAKVFPVPRGHRHDLPYAVRDLSRLLTSERGDISRSYWSTPRYTSAYIHYFLPWNLYRLSWLLPRLDFLPEAEANETIKFLDLGSGPLTLPLAIWCSRPDLRSRNVQFTCTDVSTKPMELGLSILRELFSGTNWKIYTERGHIDGILKKKEQYHCILSGNVLNELSQGRHESLEQRLELLASSMERRLMPGGRILIVEPGTRLGGKLIALFRKSALKLGLSGLAPCTHSSQCPILDQSRHGPGPSYTGWCHFISPALQVPRQLADLSKRSSLEKDSLAMSCLLLAKRNVAEAPSKNFGYSTMDDLEKLEELYLEIMEEDAKAARGPRWLREDEQEMPQPVVKKEKKAAVGEGFARVISGPIRLPGDEEPARYVCCECGIGLLKDAGKIPFGAAVPVTWDETSDRDIKTGAIFMNKAESKDSR